MPEKQSEENIAKIISLGVIFDDNPDLLRVPTDKITKAAVQCSSFSTVQSGQKIYRIVLNFYVNNFFRAKKKERMIIYTVPYESSRALDDESVCTYLRDVSSRPLSWALKEDIKRDIIEWKNFCLGHYLP